ncbi:MAG: hypothetical protein HYZ20_04345 [Burkholderiales bacterium]|nr:hypothetical protein [Burkholderiales bacterium]
MTATDPLLWAFVALAFLLLLALLASSWPGWGKALLVAAVTALYFGADHALEDVWGWPSTRALPERFVLLAAVIEEPSSTREGALFVWVNALEDGKPAARPRAFRLPYRKDLHAMLDEGMKKVRQGITQMGSAEPKSGPEGLSWLRPGATEQDVKVRDLPAPQLPEK